METKEEEQLGESIVFESFLKEKMIMGIPENGFYSLLGISVILFLFIKVFAIIPILIIFIILKVIATKNRPISRTVSVVGVSGFEPEASWSRTKRDTKLRHTPKCFSIILYRSDKIKWYFDFLLNVFNF